MDFMAKNQVWELVDLPPGRKTIGNKSVLPNSVHTRPGKENSEKNSKKIQKIKKPLSRIIFSENGKR